MSLFSLILLGTLQTELTPTPKAQNWDQVRNPGLRGLGPKIWDPVLLVRLDVRIMSQIRGLGPEERTGSQMRGLGPIM